MSLAQLGFSVEHSSLFVDISPLFLKLKKFCMLKLKTSQVVEGLVILSVFGPDTAFRKRRKYTFLGQIHCVYFQGVTTQFRIRPNRTGTKSRQNQIGPEPDRIGTKFNKTSRPSCFDFTKYYLCTYDKVEPIWFNNTRQLAVGPVTLSTNGVMQTISNRNFEKNFTLSAS